MITQQAKIYYLSYFYPQLQKQYLKKFLLQKSTQNKILLNKKKFRFIDFIKTKKNAKLCFNFFFNFKQPFTIPKYTVICKITPNNTHLTLLNQASTLIYKTTAGSIGLHSSKKNYKLVYNLVLTNFLNLLKTKKIQKNIIFKITCPKFLRRRLLRRLSFFLKNNNTFELIRKLPFNGCRPAKLRRRKRKGFKITKPLL